MSEGREKKSDEVPLMMGGGSDLNFSNCSNITKREASTFLCHCVMPRGSVRCTALNLLIFDFLFLGYKRSSIQLHFVEDSRKKTAVLTSFEIGSKIVFCDLIYSIWYFCTFPYSQMQLQTSKTPNFCESFLLEHCFLYVKV